ncbi:MAG: amino acid adenylation domain-containing protein, partial [bacterium]|nr:amino acid adenylation domain-containing protein [bacterium]
METGEIEEFAIENHDMTTGRSENPPADIDRVIREQLRPFDLTRAPLFRVGLIKVKEAALPGETQQHIMVVNIHHIIADGYSLSILIREFVMLLAGDELPALKLQYKDYSEWWNRGEQKKKLEQQETYWLNVFQGEIPQLNLPEDYLRPEIQRFEGKNAGFEIGEKETAALKELATRIGATMYMVLLGITNIFLSKLSGQEEIIIGTPVAGRRNTDIEPIIGMFVNTLALRNYPTPDKTAREFLSEVKEKALEAFDNQDYPYETLVDQLTVRRDTSRNPLFDTLLAMQNIDSPSMEVEGLKISPYPYENRTAKFDLSLYALEQDDSLELHFEYSTSIFKDATVQRFITYFKTILTGITAGVDERITDLELISEEGKKQLVVEFNDTTQPYDHGTITGLLEQRINKTPGAIAVVGPGENPETVTYSQLEAKVNELARRLRERGLAPNRIAAIMLERSVDMVTGVLAILKEGGIYLPLDTAYPEERKKYILKDSGARILLVDETPGNQPEYATGCEILTLEKRQKEDRRTEQEAKQEIQEGTNARIERIAEQGTEKTENRPENPAYIIYTSGSTGRPKGVLVEHGTVVNLLYALWKKYPFGQEDNYLLKTSQVFDVSVSELFGWILGGGRLTVLEPGGEKEPWKIMAAVERGKITHINFVPTMFNIFLQQLDRENVAKIAALKYIFLAGEALPAEQVEAFRRLETQISLENIYGPTEATVYAAWYSLRDWIPGSAVPIGKPLTNVQLYILDRHDKLLAVGVPGELVITGAGLARDYLNRPQLTAEKFVKAKEHPAPNTQYPITNNQPNNQYPIPNNQFSRTGDLCRWQPDGN